MMVLMRILVFLVLVSACTKRNQEVCCETAQECAAINTTEVVVCSVGVCVDHTCVDPGPCDGNEDCVSPATCVDGTCQTPLPPDAALVPAFDVAYPNEWRFTVGSGQPIVLDLMFMNRGVSPLSMSTLNVRSLSDDHPIAFVRVVTTSSSADIPPGSAGGRILPIAEPIMIGSGLVPEPRTDTTSSYATVEFIDEPTGTYDITVDVLLTLDGLDVPLHMVMHMEPGPTIFADPEMGTRATVFR
jgi:hypothetical protein